MAILPANDLVFDNINEGFSSPNEIPKINLLNFSSSVLPYVLIIPNEHRYHLNIIVLSVLCIFLKCHLLSQLFHRPA